jgi:hypothetical protein
MTRPLPWTELLTAIGEERFTAIREALEQQKTDALSRDAFLLNATVGQLLRDLMPEDAPSDAVNAYGALIHMLYVAWSRDWPVVAVTAEKLRAALLRPTPYAPRPLSAVCYIQLPERLVWAEPVSGEAHEPLDGIFLIVTAEAAHALAILGFRAARDGFTTMEGAIALPAPRAGPREDGAPAFTSTLPAGDRASLLAVKDAHELVSLALAGLDAAEA